MVGTALYNSVNVSVWMNLMEEKERAKVVAASYAVIRLGLITGALGGILYDKVAPDSLLYAMMGLRLLGFFLLRRASRIRMAMDPPVAVQPPADIDI
jgi:predicted MFS family arabinose efflux permease